jgi:hypothetical protein
MLDDPPDDFTSRVPAAGGPRFPLRKLAWGMVLGCAAGVALAIGVAVWLNRGQPPMMKPAELDAAEERWRKHGPADYDLDLDASLGLAGRMHVEVRKAEVVAMVLDNQSTRRHLWEYWSVPGLLEVIRLDRDRNTAAAHDPAGAQPEPVLQQAVFDSEYGFPVEYRRTAQSTGQTGGWRITRFQPVR